MKGVQNPHYGIYIIQSKYPSHPSHLKDENKIITKMQRSIIQQREWHFQKTEDWREH